MKSTVIQEEFAKWFLAGVIRKVNTLIIVETQVQFSKAENKKKSDEKVWEANRNFSNVRIIVYNFFP